MKLCSFLNLNIKAAHFAAVTLVLLASALSPHRVEAQVTVNNDGLSFGPELVEFLPLTEAISQLYNVNIIFSEQIKSKDKIHVVFPEGISKNEAWRFYIFAMDMMGVTYYPVGKYDRMVNSSDMASAPTDLFIDTFPKIDEKNPHVAILYRPKHIPVEESIKLIEKFKAKEGAAVQFNDAILYIDWQHNLAHVFEILNALDVGGGSSKIYIWKANYSNIADIQAIVEKLFMKTGFNPKSAVGLEKIVSDERSNQLIISGTEEACSKVLGLLPKLDVPITRDKHMEVVFLNGQKAEDIQATLQGVVSQKTAKTSAKHNFNEDLEVKITADKSTNAILMVGPKKGIEEIKEVIAKIDKLPRQVMIEMVVMEITLGDTSKSGLSVVGSKNVNAIDSLVMGGTNYGGLSAVQVDPTSLMGMAVGAQTSGTSGSGDKLGLDNDIPGFGIILQMLQSTSDVNLMSNPYLLAADGQDAEVIVGSNVPYITGSAMDSYNQPVLSIQRQDVGLTIKLKPSINEGGSVKLEMSLEIQDLQAMSDTLGPTTSKRAIKTVVIAKSGNTVALGGLTRDKKILDKNMVPGLGELPVLGRAFSQKSDVTEKVSLVVCLTPHIIETREQIQQLFKRKIKERSEYIREFYGSEKEDFDFNKDLHDRVGLVEEIRQIVDQQRIEAKKKNEDDEENFIIISPDTIKKEKPAASEKEVETEIIGEEIKALLE